MSLQDLREEALTAGAAWLKEKNKPMHQRIARDMSILYNSYYRAWETYNEAFQLQFNKQINERAKQ